MPSPDYKILFVDDEEAILSVVEDYLTRRGFRVTIDNGSNALKYIKEKNFDIVFTDLIMPEFSGLDVLATVKEYQPETEVIIITGYGTIESAIEAMKLGSYDYLQKPIELELLDIAINRIIEKRKLQKENIQLKKRLKERYGYDKLVGVSPQMQEIYDIIDRISLSSPTVLIQGESGTGKELLANVIHQSSARKDKPLIPVNCGAIVESLLESELFGHVKGAFTGAIRDKIGLFKAAEGGTLFLDEVAEISPPVQVKLLRVLQEKKVRSVGTSSEIDVDVRVIAATNRDLKDAVSSGRLRKDLYYRLNVVSIRLPTLEKRKEDIPLLLNHFLNKFNSRSEKKVMSISPEAEDILLSYHWPGNIRQLENVIERAFALGAGETIEVSDLPPEMKETADAAQKSHSTYALKNNEIMLIEKALLKTKGNKPEAALLLGINTATLYRKIKKYGIDDRVLQNANI